MSTTTKKAKIEASDSRIPYLQFQYQNHQKTLPILTKQKIDNFLVCALRDECRKREMDPSWNSKVELQKQLLDYCNTQAKTQAKRKTKSPKNKTLPSEESTDPISIFPQDIMLEIFLFLDPVDIVWGCALVSLAWNTLTWHRRLWQGLYLKCDYPPLASLSVGFTWKMTFIHQYFSQNMLQDTHKFTLFSRRKSCKLCRYLVIDTFGLFINGNAQSASAVHAACYLMAYNFSHYPSSIPPQYQDEVALWILQGKPHDKVPSFLGVSLPKKPKIPSWK